MVFQFPFQVVFFVSSEFLKCRFQRLLAHPMKLAITYFLKLPPFETRPLRKSQSLRARYVRAYDDRAEALSRRNFYVSALCPVVLCPYLCTPDTPYASPNHCSHCSASPTGMTIGYYDASLLRFRQTN